MKTQKVKNTDSSATTPKNNNENWQKTLLYIGIAIVVLSCICSQWLANVAKKSTLKLNKYYMRKKYEKD